MSPLKTTFLIIVASVVAAAASYSPTLSAVPDSNERVFELRTYHTPPGKMAALHTRFRDHSITLLERHGMKVVGFWVPTDADKGAADTLVYMLAHKSRAAADASWAAFRVDPEWVKVKAESEKDGTLTSKVESVFMSPTDYSPMK